MLIKMTHLFVTENVTDPETKRGRLCRLVG